MGAYTSGQEVYELLVDMNVGRPSRLTVAEVDEIVDSLEAEIDSILASYEYVVPATNARDVKMFGLKVRQKACTIVFVSLNKPERSPDWVRTWDIDYGTFLDNLSKGKIRLTGQTTEAQQDGDALIQLIQVLPSIPTD